MTAAHERRLRVGLLGAGPIAQFAHLDALAKARDAELHALCDVAEDLLAAVAARLGGLDWGLIADLLTGAGYDGPLVLHGLAEHEVPAAARLLRGLPRA